MQNRWIRQAVAFNNSYLISLASVFSAHCPDNGYFIKRQVGVESNPLLLWDLGL